MGLNHSPSIVTSNLVFAIDAANIKSINLPTQADHGWADWYCVTSGTATYSIVNAGVSIYQRTPAGVVTTVVGPSTGPTRGTVTVTVGNTYYGDGPINLVVENLHQCLVPATMSGTLFWTIPARVASQPYTVFVYSPNGPAQLKFYDSASQGIYSQPSSVLNVAQGSITSFQTANQGGANAYLWITSNVPVVATANASFDVDKTILTPMSQYVYRRYPAWMANQANTTGTLVSNSYTLYDSNTANKIMDMNVADGAGGDSAQGLGLEYLSENYSWGNYLSDYHITAPYANTIVTVQHWNGSGWFNLETHTLNGGTIQNAVAVFRDGTANVGNTGTIVSGAASYFNNSQLWKWIGNKPFYLIINDTADDEFAVLGWSTASTTLKPRTSNTITNLINSNINGNFANGLSVANNSFIFDGINDYILSTTNPTLTNQITFSIWFNPSTQSSSAWAFGREGCYRLIYDTAFSWVCATTNNAWYTAGTVVSSNALSIYNTWWNVVGTYDGSNLKIYVNGVLHNTGAAISGNIVNNSSVFNIGRNDAGGVLSHFIGSVSDFKLYNRALSAAEIQRNFNALRGRFGI